MMARYTMKYRPDVSGMMGEGTACLRRYQVAHDEHEDGHDVLDAVTGHQHAVFVLHMLFIECRSKLFSDGDKCFRCM